MMESARPVYHRFHHPADTFLDDYREVHTVLAFVNKQYHTLRPLYADHRSLMSSLSDER